MLTLLDIQTVFEKYGTDKARHKNYANFYSELFNKYTPKTILEFGVWKGESLLAWSELFPDSMITGVDLFPPIYYCDNSCGKGGVHLVNKDQCVPYSKLINNPNIKFIQGDSREISFDSKFDLIIDDAEHTLEQQIGVLKHLGNLTDDGSMVIEDVNIGFSNIIQSNIPIKYKSVHHDLRGLPDEYLIVITKQ